ncbi:hypothetical protein [Herpetosiphon llansteffanensis]|uniref:hypothetical protein n=1 Tax=Herpetosiphon llansteffanensis TaxID=2094568 RepID=UPI000D7BCC1C|nr:hypothetical protein [Herpetosiphon llansteffanensis]
MRQQRRFAWHKTLAACALALGLSLGSISFALAEGSWSSSCTGCRVGFESRRWTDNNNDASDTIIGFSQCRDSNNGNDPNDSITVELKRDISFSPDASYGQHVVGCWNAGSANFGRMATAGNYYWTIRAITGITNNAVSVNTNPVNVSY